MLHEFPIWLSEYFLFYILRLAVTYSCVVPLSYGLNNMLFFPAHVAVRPLRVLMTDSSLRLLADKMVSM
jgi:hypothetical protein